MTALIDRPSTGPSPLRRRRRSVAAAAALAALLVTAGCASNGAGGAAAGVDESLSDSGPVNLVAADGPAVDGGIIDVGEYSFPASLDPTRTQVSGYTGGTPMAAIYDVLIRLDPESGQFVPQLAEDMATADDGRTWTMTLRDGVTFSDGTALDAEAVAASIDRYVTGGGAAAQLWRHVVRETQVTGPRTLEFALDGPWADFPVLFTQGLGMIVAPAADAGAEFVPIGAGPFVLDRFVPNDEIVLTAREDYWAGRPHLDGARFLPFSDDRARADSLADGQVDATMILHSKLVSDLRAEGVSGYLGSMPMGQVTLINHRDDRPSADPRVRRAIVAAIDQGVIDQRVDEGARESTGEIFPQWSALAPSVPAVGYDPDLAAELLTEAKADGYDGHLVYISVQSPEGQAVALATQAMLEAVGFTVTVEYPGSQTDVIRRAYVEHDFDLMAGAINADPSAPYLALYGAFNSESTNNALGYDDPRTDELLEQLRTARDETEAQQVVTELQERFNETAPLVNYGARPHIAAWRPELQDARYSYSGILLLDQAWLNE